MKDPFLKALFGEPGVIQAENFDAEGEGTAFHRVEPLQVGDVAYRMDYRGAATEIGWAFGSGMLAARHTG